MTRMRRYQRDLAKGSTGAGGPGFGGPEWLWYESFNTADAAPIAASAPANPGPGTTHFTGATGSIAGGLYVEDSASVAVGPYQNTGQARGIGLAVVAYGVNFSRNTTVDFGFTSAAGFGVSSMRPGVLFTGGSLVQLDAVSGMTVFGTNPITTGSEWDLCVLADATGGYAFYRASGTGSWTLIAVTRFDVTATIFPRMRWYNAAGTMRAMGSARGVPMPAKYPLLTTGAQGIYTLPAANFFAALRLTSADVNGLEFRSDGAGNHFLGQRTAAGQLNLTRYDATVPTSVAQAAMAAAINDRVYLRLEGNTLRLSGHPTGGTWVNLAAQTITEHAANLGIKVLDEAVYDSLEAYPLTHSLNLPAAA